MYFLFGSNGVVAESESLPVYDEQSRHWIAGTQSCFDPDRLLEVMEAGAPPVAPPPLRHVTKLAFRNRFTMTEKVMIDLASIDNPAAGMDVRQQSAAVRVSLADAAAASFIDLERADTRAGVILLESAGILAGGRALAILDAEVLDSERIVA